MQSVKNNKKAAPISILIVDDSLVFRKFLGDIFDDCTDITVVGEAENGIEALDMILKTQPDVILLDMEMPLMDGMTALQHLMIHTPIPTIMFSSLTEKGTARCFDTMKNGAVDFVCKNFIFQKSSLHTYQKLLIDKVKKAAQLELKAREPVFTSPDKSIKEAGPEQRVVFCEECGNREVVTVLPSGPMDNATCSQCGDVIELDLSGQQQYRHNSSISVLGGGEGSFFNLLQIVPRLDPAMAGALIAVVHQNIDHVNAFAEYLDAISAIKVIRAREGVNIEGGSCYIASGADYMSLKPYNAQLTLQKIPKGSLKGGPLDILLASASTAYKKRAAGIILSGDERDGESGMAILVKNGGTPAILREQECFSKNMGRQIIEKCGDVATATVEHIIETVQNMDHRERYDSLAEGESHHE